MLGILICGHRGAGMTMAANYIVNRFESKDYVTSYRHIEQPLYDFLGCFNLCGFDRDSKDRVREVILEELGESSFAASVFNHFKDNINVEVVVVDGITRIEDYNYLETRGFYTMRIDPGKKVDYICSPDVSAMNARWAVENVGVQKAFLNNLEIPMHQILLTHEGALE